MECNQMQRRCATSIPQCCKHWFTKAGVSWSIFSTILARGGRYAIAATLSSSSLQCLVEESGTLLSFRLVTIWESERDEVHVFFDLMNHVYGTTFLTLQVYASVNRFPSMRGYTTESIGRLQG